MEERLAADTKENIDNQLLTEVSSRVIGNLRRRVDGRNDVETSILEEQLERRFRLAALRSERGELYHLRATRQISNETLQKLLHDLDSAGSAAHRRSVAPHRFPAALRWPGDEFRMTVLSLGQAQRASGLTPARTPYCIPATPALCDR